MDWSIVLGVIGILVSIVVGWITFRLTERRARNQRHFVAKATVLQELSKSLGEDAIPTPAIIEATLRSVVRETADPKLTLSLDEILDDLIRQVTSDPFLDAERRRKLQAKACAGMLSRRALIDIRAGRSTPHRRNQALIASVARKLGICD